MLVSVKSYIESSQDNFDFEESFNLNQTFTITITASDVIELKQGVTQWGKVGEKALKYYYFYND